MHDTAGHHRVSVGVGFKPEHFADIRETHPPVGFWEIHAENYLVAGGPLRQMLDHLRERYPVSLHGVGLSIGGVEALDQRHLSRLADLVRRVDPMHFSEHLAWSSHGGVYGPDLLPLPYRADTLQQVCDHLDQVQSRLGRRVLLENPSTYVEFASSTYSEGEFLTQVVKRSGCAVLLDINNLYVSSINHGRDPVAALREMPLDAVAQCHLAGFAVDRDVDGGLLLIDDHGSRVADAVWDLYREAVRLTGPLPTLIEWDQDVPPLAVLLGEAERAACSMEQSIPWSAGALA